MSPADGSMNISMPETPPPELPATPATPSPEAIPGDLLSLRQLAAALSVDPGQLSKESKRPGFPKHPTPAGVGFLVEEVRAWRQGNVRRKKIVQPSTSPAQERKAADRHEGTEAWRHEGNERGGGAGESSTRPAQEREKNSPPPSTAAEALDQSKAGGSAGESIAAEVRGVAAASCPPQVCSPQAGPMPVVGFVPPPPEPPDPEERSVLDILRSGTASPIEISRAAVQLAARRVAKAQSKGGLAPNDLESLKKSLQELRQGEAADIELGKVRGELIPIGDVKAIVGELCARLVQVCSVLENSIATELSIWLNDPKVHSWSADDRKLRVREFVAKTCAEVRTLAADEIDGLIEKASAEAE
jgi:hypothetical protein